jgi:hypothetical protein
VDAEAGDGLSIAVEKHALLRPSLGGGLLQFFQRNGPQRTGALLVPFAGNSHTLGMSVNIPDWTTATIRALYYKPNDINSYN